MHCLYKAKKMYFFLNLTLDEVVIFKKKMKYKN